MTADEAKQALKEGQIYYEIPTKSLVIITWIAIETFVQIEDEEGNDLFTRNYLKEDCIYIGDL